MLAPLFVAVASPFPFGPPPGPVVLAPLRPRKAWQIVVEPGGNGGAASFDLPDGLLLWASKAVLSLLPTGGARWREPFAHKGKGTIFGPKSISIGEAWIATRFELRADHDWDLVVFHDRRTGREIARFEVDRGHPAEACEAEAGGVRLRWYDGSARYDLRGRERSRDSTPNPSPKVSGPYGGIGPAAFAWKGGFVDAWAYDHNGLDYGDLSGLAGVAFLKPLGESWIDAWEGRGIGYGERDRESGSKPPILFERAVCADADGVWCAGDARLAFLLEDGRIDPKRPQPPIDNVCALPAWTDRGILFVRQGRSWMLDGRKVRRVGAWPTLKGTLQVRASRFGLVRSIGVPARGKPSTTAFRLDPVGD